MNWKWFLDIEIVEGAIGITLFNCIFFATGFTEKGVVVSFGVYKLITLKSLEWRKV